MKILEKGELNYAHAYFATCPTCGSKVRILEEYDYWDCSFENKLVACSLYSMTTADVHWTCPVCEEENITRNEMEKIKLQVKELEELRAEEERRVKENEERIRQEEEKFEFI